MAGALAMAAALPSLAGAAVTCAACYGLGALLLARFDAPLRPLERFPLAFLLGAAGLHLAIFSAMALHVAYRPVLILLLLGLIGGGIVADRSRTAGGWAEYRSLESLAPEPLALEPLVQITCGVIFGCYTIFYFINAWAPESSPDGSAYHLELVGRYVRAHGFEPVTTNMYAGLSEGVEILFAPAFAIGRHSAATLVHFFFTVILGLLIYAYGCRIGKPRVGAAAAILTYVSPIVGITGSSAYVDVAAAAVVFSVFYWLEIWDGSRDSRLLVPLGLMAGYGYAVKYTVGVMLLYALVFVAWRARRLKPVLAVAACASVMILPWMIKDWVYLHNPIAPFGNALFRNPNLFPLPEQEWTQWLRSYDLANKWTLPLQVTIYGDKTQGVIGVAFLALPLALLALRFRAGRRLLVPGLVMLAVYFANIATRFLIPCLPFFSLSLALALESAGPLLALLVVMQAFLSWPMVVSQSSARYGWHLAHFPIKAALRLVPEDRFLRETSPGFELARMVEQYVPRGERVFLLNGIPEAYTSREVLVGFQSSLGLTLQDMLATTWSEDSQPTRMLLFRFPGRSLRRVRLLQTARLPAPQQWSVHEVRFLNGGMELPRRPEWRLRAFPDPWNVQLAFDNSGATRWRSWEAASPGMYIDVDFGREQQIDEVRLETSPDASGVQVELQAMERGRWVPLAGRPDQRKITPQGSLGRAAAFEFNARGIHYLLLQDGDYSADLVQDDPGEWGVSVVARRPGGILYEVRP